MTLIYDYKEDTGELIGSRTARLDPLDGLPLVPRNATLETPPEVDDNQVAVFSNNLWSTVSDYRGDYWDVDGNSVLVTELGESLPQGLLTVKPAPTDASYAATHRATRNYLLSETDWRFRSDLTPSQGWVSYCQQLRDITIHDNWPNLQANDWPTKPS